MFTVDKDSIPCACNARYLQIAESSRSPIEQDQPRRILHQKQPALRPIMALLSHPPVVASDARYPSDTLRRKSKLRARTWLRTRLNDMLGSRIWEDVRWLKQRAMIRESSGPSTGIMRGGQKGTETKLSTQPFSRTKATEPLEETRLFRPTTTGELGAGRMRGLQAFRAESYSGLPS